VAELQAHKLSSAQALSDEKAKISELAAKAEKAEAELKAALQPASPAPSSSSSDHEARAGGGGIGTEAQRALMERQTLELVSLHGSKASLEQRLSGMQERFKLLEMELERSGLKLAEAVAEAEVRKRGEAVALKEFSLARQQRDEVLSQFGSTAGLGAAAGDAPSGSAAADASAAVGGSRSSAAAVAAATAVAALAAVGTGLRREEADALRKRCKQLEAEREGLKRERQRHSDLASAAAEQAKQVLGLREASSEECEALRRRCSELEGLSEDGLIIGSLQRQLSSTKVSYKAFVRK
jgi:hypothetical protein